MISLQQLWSTARRGLAEFRPTRRWVQSALTLLLLGLTAFAVRPAEAISREAINASLRATVQVIMPDNDFEIFALGSGTIMTPEGLVLTNHHVVEGDSRNGFMNDDGLAAIAVTPSNLRGEAVIKYYAEVVKIDPDLDLALLQIVALSDDPEAPLPDNLGLSPILRGNSDDLQIGDEINFYGFPGLGGNSVTFTSGRVSGFLDEDRNGVFEWIKTDGELNHGNSGGLATNDQGAFVGVPSAGVTDDVGKISLVRDGNLSLAFVNSYFPGPLNNGASVSNVQFAEAVTRRGQPVNPALEFPAGITDLYAVFDYEGFEDGLDLTYVWYTNGSEIASESFAWDGGESGSSWVNVFNDNGLGEGLTELELIYDGNSIYRGGVNVGEGPGPEPTPDPSERSIGELRFAQVDDSGNYGEFGDTFSDIFEVVGVFDYAGMSNGTEWGYAWFYEGQNVADNQLVWDADEEGTFELYLSHPDGLPEGSFSLEVYVEGETAQTGNFAVQAGGPGPVSDVGVVGTIVDRNNNRTTVSGALVVFLTPGNTVREWVDADFDESMVHGTATSNRRGEFQLSARITPGELYSIVVVHDDYEPIAVDDFEVPADASDPYELFIEMDRS
jgi:S1-C subfamily serine protease